MGRPLTPVAEPWPPRLRCAVGLVGHKMRNELSFIMKTKQMLLLALLLLGVSLGHEAQAFYNPSPGRWLSRDPVGENGGGNVYGFVANNSLSGYDVLGLWNSDVHRDSEGVSQ